MSDPPPTDDQDILRSSELWHRDGSVVLQAGGKQFRVHWSVLSLNSPFFRDIEALPQPPDEIKLVDGCHLILMPDDSAGDVELVLKALYNPLFSSEKPLPLTAIASHIRISRKYDFGEILQTMVDRLSYENPKSPDAYDRLNRDNKYITTWIESYRGFNIDVLTLARENNMHAVLPCAYYRVVLFHSQRELFDGVKRADGTRATLSPSDQRLCNLARTQIIQSQWEPGNTFGWIRARPPECMDTVGCRATKLGFFQNNVWTNAAFATTPRVMQLMRMCPVCTADAITSMQAGRKKMWESLPSFFGLAPWADLTNDV